MAWKFINTVFTKVWKSDNSKSYKDILPKNPDIVMISERITKLSAEYNYSLLIDIIDLMEKIIVTKDYTELLPLLENKAIFSSHLFCDFTKFIEKGYDSRIIVILVELNNLCKDVANAYIRLQCIGILLALEEFKLRRINDCHYQWCSKDRESYISANTYFIEKCAEEVAFKRKMPNEELSFMLQTLICYYKCVPEDFIGELDIT
jgi:hypothetical protein